MTRILVISAIAFAAAPNVWAQSGCYKSKAATKADEVCLKPSIGYCVFVTENMKPAEAPANCQPKMWYSCLSSSNKVCPSGSFVLNSNGEEAKRRRLATAANATIEALVAVAEEAPSSENGARVDTTNIPRPGALPPTTLGQVGPGQAHGGAVAPPPNQVLATVAPQVILAPPPPIPSAPIASSDPAIRRAVQAEFTAAQNASNAFQLNNSETNRLAAIQTQQAYTAKLQEVQGTVEDYNTTTAASDREQARAERNNARPTGRDQDDASECELSGKLDPSMGCGGTRRMMKAAEITNQIGQIGGTVATQIGGAQAQNSALNQGTQSAAIRGAAAVQGNTGKTQMMLGAVGTMMGFMQMNAGRKHDKNSKTIKDGFKKQDGAQELYTTQEGNYTNANFKNHGDTIAGKALDNTRINSIYELKEYHRVNVATVTKARDDAAKAMENCAGVTCTAAQARLDQKQEELTNAVNAANREVSRAGTSVSENAMSEQRKIADEAKNSGMMAMLQGAQQLGQGVLNVKAAGQLNAAADQMQQTENDSNLVLVPPGQDNFQTVDPRTPTVITGNGAPPPGQDPASQDQTPTEDGSSPLGAGLPGPVDNAPTGAAPAPGKFTPGGAGGGALAGGGGIGGLNGGSTQAPGPDQGDKGPTAANSFVSGTTPVSGGGMMGPPPAGAKDAGINPAEMLAQALGLNKPQEKDPSGQAYSGARGPASAAGMGNGLGLPEEDIFKIVEGGYRRQIKAGNIGG